MDISRKAELYETSSGMVTITGGKLTTWRRMAKMAVDRLVEREARDAPCRTHEIPLGQAIEASELPRVEGVREDAYAPLAGALRPCRSRRPGDRRQRGELAQPVVEGRPDLLAEVVHAARREQARTVGDVLLRRTRLGLVAARDVAAPDGDGRAPRRRRDGSGDRLGRRRPGGRRGGLRRRGARRGHRPRMTTVGRAP